MYFLNFWVVGLLSDFLGLWVTFWLLKFLGYFFTFWVFSRFGSPTLPLPLPGIVQSTSLKSAATSRKAPSIKAAAWGGLPCSTAVSPPRRHFLDVFVEVSKPYKMLSESSRTFGVFCTKPLGFFFFLLRWAFCGVARKRYAVFFSFFSSSRCRPPPRTTPTTNSFSAYNNDLRRCEVEIMSVLLDGNNIYCYGGSVHLNRQHGVCWI